MNALELKNKLKGKLIGAEYLSCDYGENSVRGIIANFFKENGYENFFCRPE